jgi:hypothetical protein
MTICLRTSPHLALIFREAKSSARVLPMLIMAMGILLLKALVAILYPE